MEKKWFVGIFIYQMLAIAVGIVPVWVILRQTYVELGIHDLKALEHVIFTIEVSSPFLLLFVAGLGVFFRKNWGRFLYILLGFLSLLFGLYGFGHEIFIKGPHSQRDILEIIIWELFYLGFGVLTCWFFTRPKVKEQFK